MQCLSSSYLVRYSSTPLIASLKRDDIERSAALILALAHSTFIVPARLNVNLVSRGYVTPQVCGPRADLIRKIGDHSCIAELRQE